VILPSSSSAKTSGPATLRVPCSGVPTPMSATAWGDVGRGDGLDERGWQAEMFSSVGVTASMNSKCVARTIENGRHGAGLEMSSCCALARYVLLPAA
jgi:hypothetical protein